VTVSAFKATALSILRATTCNASRVLAIV